MIKISPWLTAGTKTRAIAKGLQVKNENKPVIRTQTWAAYKNWASLECKCVFFCPKIVIYIHLFHITPLNLTGKIMSLKHCLFLYLQV